LGGLIYADFDGNYLDSNYNSDVEVRLWHQKNQKPFIISERFMVWKEADDKPEWGKWLGHLSVLSGKPQSDPYPICRTQLS